MSVKEVLSGYYEHGKSLAYRAAAKVTSISKKDITEGISKVVTGVAHVFQTAYNTVLPWQTQQAVPEVDDEWEDLGPKQKDPKRSKKND